MDAHAKREPVDREIRRRQLARRLVAHGARTRTISLLTGLSRHQQATLRQRWRVPQNIRHRGPLPNSFANFRTNSRVREEAAALAALWRCVAHISSRSQAKVSEVECGEQLCDAFEIYLACLLKSEFEFEHLTLLARGLDEASTIALSNCTNCEGVILLDLQETRRYRCSHCHQWAEGRALSLPEGNVMSELPPEGGEAVQRELF